MSDFILSNQIAFYYTLIGLAFLGLTFQPAMKGKVYFNIPALYIGVGVLSAILGLPVINPLNSEIELKIVEHASELIVIISLAGAGLSIDLKIGWSRWAPTWRLLFLALPLTILGTMGLGLYGAGLGLAGAALLGAALAPTDPVLARSVSVGSPNSHQRGTETTLTSEAGLNDGLAFPFIWLAIGLSVSVSDFSWASWVLYEGIYKVIVGVIIGMATGWGITKILFSEIGDAENGKTQVALVVLSGTFLAYGVAEFVGGYGFLSVFISARAGRALTKDTKAEPYENKAHRSADQMESVLLAVTLLWFGSFIGGVIYEIWTVTDLAIAATIVFIIRPVVAGLSLIGIEMSRLDRAKIAFFGIRGMGSIFYMAFALTHGSFEDPERLWSILSLTILLSAGIHGCLAKQWMGETK